MSPFAPRTQCTSSAAIVAFRSAKVAIGLRCFRGAKGDYVKLKSFASLVQLIELLTLPSQPRTFGLFPEMLQIFDLIGDDLAVGANYDVERHGTNS